MAAWTLLITAPPAPDPGTLDSYVCTPNVKWVPTGNVVQVPNVDSDAMSDADLGSPSGLRASNRERILALLRARGPMSQADLARASGLSPATISGIARELREAGWLEDEDADGPARGRALALSRSAGVAVGIDFGHSHVRVAVADLAHTVLAEAAEPLDVDHEADEGVALAGRLVRRLLDEVGVAADRVTGVGMGLPGPLRRDSGEVGDSAILPGWIGARPEALMHAELGLPVRVENDANLGALAEIVWGAGRDCSDLVYVKVATGVGAGLVLNGRLYHGAGGTAGEIGHVTIDDAGPVCRCGNRGCLEAFAGAEAVLEPLRRRHGDRLTQRQVVLQAQAGDVGCRRVIADAGRALGRAVAGTCNLLAPERVLVGGELAQAGDLLLEPLREAVARSAIAATREVPVLAGVLGERAEVLGAVALRESQRFVAAPERVV
jgi:predicted NBD/HSP70 family sugar kinase